MASSGVVHTRRRPRHATRSRSQILSKDLRTHACLGAPRRSRYLRADVMPGLVRFLPDGDEAHPDGDDADAYTDGGGEKWEEATRYGLELGIGEFGYLDKI